jgi:short-subunit dehydrogenase
MKPKVRGEDNASGIAIVTGASSGIGASFARRLAASASGAETYPGLPAFDELWLVARRAGRLADLAAGLAPTGIGAPGENTLAIKSVPLDLAAPGSAGSLADAVSASGKPLRVLVNNAGYGSYGPFDRADLDAQLGMIDLNCRSLTECCGRLGTAMGAGGLIVNVASLAGFFPLGNFAVYAATKAYVHNFSLALAAEWGGRGIRVCALCPGSVESEFALVASGGARREVRHGFSADKTTRRCLRSAAKGSWVSLPRLAWRLNRRLGLTAGPRAMASFSNRFMKRPHAKGEEGK